MKNPRKSSPTNNMRKYYQLILVIVCFISIVTLLIYRHEYYRLHYVLEVLNFYGKPGLSEIEFCGPGFNATMLSDLIKNSSLEVRESQSMFQQINEDFYAYSSYLKSYQKYDKLQQSNAQEIDTIVVGKVSQIPKLRCNVWFDDNMKPKPGKFTFKVIKTNAKGAYSLLMFHCSMSKDFGQPIAVSFYENDYNVNPVNAPIHRVIPVNTKKQTEQSSSIKFVNNIDLGLCVIPNKVPIISKSTLIEFLVYYHMMGVRKFTVYDSMISEDTIKRLNLLPFDLTKWHIKFFPLNYPFVFSKSYRIVRSAIELDCMYRNFQVDKEITGRTSHVMTLSWDEFVVPRYHDNIKSVLTDFDPMRKLSSISLLNLVFCTNQNNDDSVHEGYPNMVKKTHYFKTNDEIKTLHLRNLDRLKSFDEILQISNGTDKLIPQDVMAVHKYKECGDPNNYNSGGYNESQLQMIPHKFEGAMLKFGRNMVNNKLYRLYASGQIWEKTDSEKIRDML